MTDTPTLIRQLGTLAAFLRDQASRPKADRTRLEAAGQELAVLREQLRDQTLVTLPQSDEHHCGRWYLDGWSVEAGTEAVVIDGEPYPVGEARELGLALLAAADRATCPCLPGAPQHLHSQGGYRTEDVTA